MRWVAVGIGLLFMWLAGVAMWIGTGPEEMVEPKADYAIVLGAAVDGEKPSPVFAARIDHAIELYRSGAVGGLIFTGARSGEDTLSESRAAMEYASANGVPRDTIRIEEASRTTRQNLVEADRVLGGDADTSVLIVSDPLHLRRAMVMADDLGLDAAPSATPTTRYRSWSTKAPFLLREVYFLHHYWLFGQ